MPRIISLSASAARSDQEDSLAAGASAFLPKPINFDKLLDQVGALLHLSWNYGEPEEGTEPARPLLPPPPEEMDVLLHLAMTGNMSDIRQRAAYLASLDERYRPFAQQLSTLARGYQSRAILQMVEKYRQGQ